MNSKNLIRIMAWGIAGYAAYKFMQKLLPGVQAAINTAAKSGKLSAKKATAAVTNPQQFADNLDTIDTVEGEVINTGGRRG